MLLWNSALAGNSCFSRVDLVLGFPQFSGGSAVSPPVAGAGTGYERPAGGAIESFLWCSYG